MHCSCGNIDNKSCKEMFDEILAKEFSDFNYGRVHRLTVDSYSLQHPDPYMVSAKSFAAHLTGMCCTMMYDNDQQLMRLLQRWLNGNRVLIKPDLLEGLGSLNISHIMDSKDGPHHQSLVREWAAKVWEAYTPYHDLAQEWIHSAQKESPIKIN